MLTLVGDWGPHGRGGCCEVRPGLGACLPFPPPPPPPVTFLGLGWICAESLYVRPLVVWSLQVTRDPQWLPCLPSGHHLQCLLPGPPPLTFSSHFSRSGAGVSMHAGPSRAQGHPVFLVTWRLPSPSIPRRCLGRLVSWDWRSLFPLPLATCSSPLASAWAAPQRRAHGAHGHLTLAFLCLPTGGLPLSPSPLCAPTGCWHLPSCIKI